MSLLPRLHYSMLTKSKKKYPEGAGSEARPVWGPQCPDEAQEVHDHWCFRLGSPELKIENPDVTRSKRDLLSEDSIREKHVTDTLISLEKGKYRCKHSKFWKDFGVDIQLQS